MTRAVGLVDGRMRIVLPGTWVNVPLDSPEVATRFVKRIVRRQVGNADRLARVRRDATQELVANVRDAVGIGVHSYLMSLEILPGIPFPAAMLLLDEAWPPAAAAGLAAGDVAAALAAAYPAGEVAEQRSGPVARLVEMARSDVTTDDGEPSLTMRLEYHVPYPAGDGLLLVRVVVPGIPSAEPFATLFDEIVDSVTFVTGGGAERT
ncbi:hypothetical protein [Luteimicrobium subarcticum]|uniref:Uncharacterized protein n=1 Tax=Luteimicrobium subarcticum TaxID=620910 RepID=A0A2M8WVM4_9MICO|nr:hypothetical protein [Luteimicrobium subarcticum]PJI94977.1 hypothetical protein CLV34_0829 [Luteimicrobium subarcticum]